MINGLQDYFNFFMFIIIDYLDNGYYKKSLQEIDKLQKKNKDWLYLKVLKALTYIRMNRPKEGEEILEQVVQEFPYDDSTLQTITICYRDLHQSNYNFKSIFTVS